MRFKLERDDFEKEVASEGEMGPKAATFGSESDKK